MRAARRACWSSISASSPRASSESGISSTSKPAEADRLGGHVVVGGRRVALGEHEVDHGEDAVEPFGSASAGGTRYGMPALAILRLARSSR